MIVRIQTGAEQKDRKDRKRERVEDCVMCEKDRERERERSDCLLGVGLSGAELSEMVCSNKGEKGEL